MANIESKLTTIKSASGGEDVRDAIIGALRDINNDVPADMSNPVQIKEDMPLNSDLTIPLNPPKLVSQILIKQAGSGGKSTTLNDITITENGEYPTDDEGYDPNKENRYYSKVTVKVPQLANAVLDLEEEITQNGTYSAPADWGVDGIRTFTVNVNAATGDGPFQVEFYDKPQTDPTAKAIYTELVPKGGSVSFKGTALPTDPSGLGRPFAGWNPSPIDVTRDMKCYPNFASQHMVPGEIGPDWDVICADGGASYPIGSYRRLYFSATITKEELNAIGATGYTDDITVTFETIMTKVAEGEDGSKSTWLSLPDSLSYDPERWAGFTKYLAWPDRYERKWLQLLYTKFAPCFLQHIKPVTKYTQCSSDDVPPYSIVPTQDALWCASLKELCVDNDYWHDDIAHVWYNGSREYEDIKAKYYDGVPLDIPYVNNANLTPKQRDDLFYLSPGQAYSGTQVLLRDAGPSFSDRRVVIGTERAEYTNPETSQTEDARYIKDGGVPPYLPMIFGFCLV